jgi:hypothetical protein
MDVNGQLHAPATLPQRKSRRYLLDMRLSEPQSRSWHGGEEKNSLLCPCQESNPDRTVRTLVTILTALPLSRIEPWSSSPYSGNYTDCTAPVRNRTLIVQSVRWSLYWLYCPCPESNPDRLVRTLIVILTALFLSRIEPWSSSPYSGHYTDCTAPVEIRTLIVQSVPWSLYWLHCPCPESNSDRPVCTLVTTLTLLPQPEIEPWSSSPFPGHYTDWPTPAPIFPPSKLYV